jgi:ubiquinone/menaquinone biosynthesis C-methylase UbiE
MSTEKFYPDSGVELRPFIAKHYDAVMDMASVGFYKFFIHKAIKNIGINAEDSILDLGCGTGRNALLMASYLNSHGTITGLDISTNMEHQFRDKFKSDQRINFVNQRIDTEFDLNQKFDIVFISFVIHGFPHEVRKTVIDNAYRHLKEGGRFVILDFAEFDMRKMPFTDRWIFKTIECKYAFDFIERDWKSILSESGFYAFKELFYFKKYVRLLTAMKQ